MCCAVLNVLILSVFPLSADGLVVKNYSHSQKQKQDEKSAKWLQACLAHKRIVFIGPSTSKFDYLSLAYLAEYGRLPSEEVISFGQGRWGPNPLNELGFKHNPAPPPWEVIAPITKPGCTALGGDWETYMRYSNLVFNGHEVCDCYKFGKWAGAYDMYNSTENRIYTNPNTNTMISFFQWFGDIVPPRGTFDISPLLSPTPVALHQQQCPVGQFPGKWAWSLTLAHFLSQVVRYAKPTHVVVSSSFWPIHPENKQLWEEVAAAGVESVMDSGGKVMWRSTPQRVGFPAYPTPRVDMTPFVNKGWSVFPAQQIVAQFQGAQSDDAIFYDFAHIRAHTQCHLTQTFVQTQLCV
mmetsp:Transcript_61935/g.98124  ORF Transcript_61935/g.98124 Transcript_61935/m.98124 type:complete len:351 (-) Transcript_61935:6-1058(-)